MVLILMLHLKIMHHDDEYIGDAENIDVVMPLYNLIECSDIYLHISGLLW